MTQRTLDIYRAEYKTIFYLPEEIVAMFENGETVGSLVNLVSSNCMHNKEKAREYVESAVYHHMMNAKRKSLSNGKDC